MWFKTGDITEKAGLVLVEDVNGFLQFGDISVYGLCLFNSRGANSQAGCNE